MYLDYFCPMPTAMIYWQVINNQHCVDMKLIPDLPTLGIKYKLYWIITSVAYILGLVATFISLFLMNSAPPALLIYIWYSSHGGF